MPRSSEVENRVVDQEEWPDDAPISWGHRWECGWCEKALYGRFAFTVKMRLLIHQWFNHRAKINEEYVEG